MTSIETPPVVVVLQLTGGNDYFNSVIPYTDSNYYDNRRSALQIAQDDVLRLDDKLGLHPTMGPLQEIYQQGDMAIIHGVGYQNSPRSHFRSMDIWHTCEPDIVGTEGWVGRIIRDLDPRGENPVTGVNIGQALPRALVVPGVSVASVADLSTYGLLTNIEEEARRTKILERFSNMYGQAIGTGAVKEYLGRTGLDAMKGADILKEGLSRYSSSIEYASDAIAKSLRDVAMIHTADVGTRVFYTQHGSFDTHASQPAVFDKLWTEVSNAISDFWADLREHDADDNVLMFLFSEFGRRVRDNGSGTDHGAAGACFAIGPSVAGGMHSEYPQTRSEALEQGDLAPNLDFRGVYSTILEDWLGLDAVPIVNGHFEKPGFVAA
ncbi:MAG TPA: hypothetical protein DDY93_08825 [Dehalococcoidia bacterium]|jgi:uncharacterized protein (DUF1501 family)|nr:DUF1501 domain-containing protein [SAR202 cluster bacterium]PCH92640.1 MAG: hypothetical protein COB86_02415 [Dehalococcoidia bacterium]MQG82159.1 DUF1501 domain-containing protein [SAR202 cluster bacterium]HAC18464.1 hypothetical protein [Dehalococcoidia bacterium]HBJ31451.1 hypothetical protein [Dehalococcoidia bacterium]|tara:strand:- start:10662 stop:11798 length:1137 start_codon:yes stop_codon:yes gene_type:complete